MLVQDRRCGYEDESSLYYLQSRYYNPELGRFINADSFVATGAGLLGFNMFAYCNNTPIVCSDSSGNLPIRNTMLHANDGGNGMKGIVPHKIDITEKLNHAMSDNAAELSEYNDKNNFLDTVTYFVNKVKPGGEWDFKSQDEWGLNPNTTYVYDNTDLRFDDIGNIHYGYVGRVIFSTDILLCAGGVVQIYAGTSRWSYWKTNFDDPQDQWAIKFGCDLWDSEALP